jgi:hypothetical protein
LWSNIKVFNPLTGKYCLTQFESREMDNYGRYITVTMKLIPIESAGGGAKDGSPRVGTN